MQEIDETEIKANFNELCRLCASIDNVKIGLFSDEAIKRQLRKKIQTCLPFKVEENDGLPKSLCFKCIYNLETTYEFRCKCVQVNRSLEKHLYQLEREKQTKNVIAGRSYKIHPEVSIFAISTDSSREKQNEIKSSTPVECEEEPPNPLDFLEVGVNSEESSSIRPKSNAQDGKKSPFWKTDRRWLSVEHKPLHNDSTFQNDTTKMNMKYFDTSTPDDSGSRRKSCKPRKIARESDGNVDCGGGGGSAIPAAIVPSSDVNRIAGKSRDGSEENENENDIAEEDESSRQQERFTCLLCEKSFNLRSSLNKHFSTTHGIEPYEVQSSEMPQQRPLLSQSFMSQLSAETTPSERAKNDDDLENMMEQETVIFCEVCRREFQDRASLWLHMVHAHREEASVSCGICLKICCDNITLIEHVNTAHSGDKAVVQRRYSCQVCGRQHDSRQKLLKHATLHTLIDNQGQTIQPEEMVSLNNAFAPRECTVCRKRFFNEDKLNHHTRNFHNDANDTATLSPSAVYKCELCASAHATRIDRWWHMYYSHLGDARVTCQRDNCRKIFVSAALMEEHSKTHHESQGDFTNTCEICGKLWESRTVFYKHMMNVHPKCLPTICGICMKIFSNVPELRQHVQADHPPLEEMGGICCDVCGRPYAERSKMLRHRRVHNVTDGVPTATSTAKKKDDLVCSFCPDVSFEQYDDIAQHRRTVHQLFVCDLCPKFYNGNNHLWKHVSKQHKGDPNVTCNLCLRTSASRAHLERHKIKYHSDPVDKLLSKQHQLQLQQQQQLQQQAAAAAAAGAGSIIPIAVITPQQQQPHKCSLCGKLFRIRSLLKKHLKSCKGVKALGASAAAAASLTAKVLPVNGVFPCSKCTKVFQLQSVLSKHVKNSHAQHACEACQQEGEISAFDTKKALLQHIRERHADNYELVCDVVGCGKVLRLKADLKKHKLEHQRGYFTYICEICGDMFSNRKKLRKHLVTYHKADVKYLCAICASIHQSVDQLVEHVHGAHSFVLHRPCTCQICGKNWTVSSKVVDHIVKVHGPEYKPCKICWKVFTDEQAFQEHTDNHPAIEEKPSAAAAANSSSSVNADADADDETMAEGPHSPSPPAIASLSRSSSCGSIAAAADAKSECDVDAAGSKTVAGVKRSLQSNEEDSSLYGGDNDDNDESASKRLRRKYKCIWCKETFRAMDELKQHKLAHHSNNRHGGESQHQQQQINVDNSDAEPKTEMEPILVSAADTAGHQQQHQQAQRFDTSRSERWTDIRPIACDCCDKIWNSKKQLWQHLIRSHAYESQHTCGICLQVCRDYFDLFYHLDSQHSELVNDTVANRFSCFICGHYHNSQSKLDKHFLLHKNAPSRCEYTCQYCRKVYKSVAFYRDHLRVHEAEQPAESKAKPISEFSGFSINHILATKNDRSRSLTNLVVPAAAVAVPLPVPLPAPTLIKIETSETEPSVSFHRNDYDTKMNDDNDDDDDLVEEMDDDDEDTSDREQMDVEEESPRHDDDSSNAAIIDVRVPFSRLARSSEKPTTDSLSESYSNVSASDDEVEDCTVKSDNGAAANDAADVMLNGGGGVTVTNNDFTVFAMNNNQKQRSSKFQNDKTNFHNSTGDDYLRRVTDNL